MKSLTKKDAGVSPVIAVILMVAITVVLAGVVFLWAQSFTSETDQGVTTMNLKGTIDDGDEDLILEVISGTYAWGDYRITVDGAILTTADTSTSAGGSVIFNDDVTPVTFTVGTSYNVKIIDIAQDKMVWEDDIIAVA